MLPSLVNFDLCNQRLFLRQTLPQTLTINLLFLRQSIEPIFMDLTKSCNVIMSDLYLAYLAPLCFVVHVGLY